MMQRSALILLFCFFTGLAASAQQLIFCEGVDTKGVALHPATNFFLPGNSGAITALITCRRPLECVRTTLDIFRIDKTGKEIFESTVHVKTEPYWTWFSQRIAFTAAGDYTVYAYDEHGTLLGLASLHLMRKQ